MHHVDQLLKQYEVAWIRSYTCPDEDAIEALLLEIALNNRFRGFAEVGQTHLHAVPEASQLVFRGFETGQYLRRIHTGRVAGLREIDQGRIQPDHEYAFLVGHGSLHGEQCSRATSQFPFRRTQSMVPR